MLDVQTFIGKVNADSLASVEAAERFWQTLPRHDPVEFQRRLCAALAKIDDWGKPDLGRFRALRALDWQTHSLIEATLSESVALGRQATLLSKQLCHSALSISRAFATAYEFLLRSMRDTAPGRAWLERLPDIVACLFRHREIDLFLTLCRFEAWPGARWKDLHQAYAFALANQVAQREAAVYRLEDKSIVAFTPEHMYLRVLLLQLAGGGQFLPHEIALVRRALGRWSAPLALVSELARTADAGDGDGFVLDLAGSGGLARPPIVTSGTWLRVDTMPLATAIDKELAATQAAVPANGSRATTIARRSAVLTKLKVACAPRQIHFRRRGERKAIAMLSVQATIGGLSSIFRVLREQADRPTSVVTASEPYVDEITITDVGSFGTRTAHEPTAVFPETTSFGVSQSFWQVRDRSDSGCRLRGRVYDTQRLVPGSLIAFRDDEATPWTVAVVRRLNRLVGNDVELGAELLGRNPQRAVLFNDSSSAGAAMPLNRPERFAALYLPESSAQPRAANPTLLLPACEFAAGRRLTMLSASKEVAIRLEEPLERQLEFVWASFEVVD